MTPPRRRRPTALIAASAAAALLSPRAVRPFAVPSPVGPRALPPRPSGRPAPGGHRAVLAATPSRDDDVAVGGPGRSPAAAAASALLAASLLLSAPLLPPPEAFAAPPPPLPASQTATSIDIDLKSLPALTRKVVANREKLTGYLIDSFRSFKPILDVLSNSDTVTVRPPKDVKGAINQALTRGDAQFLVNGQAVDVRIESVPGVIVVRVINPNIPRVPFLRDGTAALRFVDEIVDVAPAGLERAAEEVEALERDVEAIEKFLFWGAPQKAPVQYKGSSLDYFLSSKFLWNGRTVSLGALGELTNSEVVLVGVGTGVAAAYGSSFAYYVSLQEAAEKEAEERKAEVVAKKAAAKKAAADAAAAAKKEADAAARKAEEEAKAAEATKVEEARAAEETEVREEKAKTETDAAASKRAAAALAAMGETFPEVAEEAETSSEEADTPRGRKRDAIRNLFRRGKKE